MARLEPVEQDIRSPANALAPDELFARHAERRKIAETAHRRGNAGKLPCRDRRRRFTPQPFADLCKVDLGGASDRQSCRHWASNSATQPSSLRRTSSPSTTSPRSI